MTEVLRLAREQDAWLARFPDADHGGVIGGKAVGASRLARLARSG